MTSAASDQDIKDEVFRSLLVLEQELDYWREVWDHGKGKYPARYATMGALDAVNRFLESFPHFDAKGLVLPLAKLQLALGDALRGVSNPLIAIERVKGGQPHDSDRQNLRVVSAICASLLMDGGASKDDAYSEVAKSLCEMGFDARGRRWITKITVAKWRERVTSAAADDPERESYDRLLLALKTAIRNTGDSAGAVVKRLLKAMPTLTKP